MLGRHTISVASPINKPVVGNVINSFKGTYVKKYDC